MAAAITLRHSLRPLWCSPARPAQTLNRLKGNKLSFKRRPKRKNVSKKKKKAERAIAKKISLFHKIPDACMVCKEAFDKKNREQAFTWNVVVKREQGVVNLYCPSCWDHAMDVVKKHNPEEEHEV